MKGKSVTVTRSVVLGTGSYLPERVLSNDELARMVETSDDWIVQRTGIRQRHIAAEGETTADLAEKAARRALDAAGLQPTDIDLIVLATATPNHTFPATAVEVQARLGSSRGAAFDLQAVCSGFVYGMATADSMIRTGLASRALVIGAETFSRILDWNDRTTCVLFGDGAGAAVLEARPGRAPSPTAGCSPRIFVRTAGTGRSSTWTAARPPPARSGTSGWKARRSSSSRSAR